MAVNIPSSSTVNAPPGNYIHDVVNARTIFPPLPIAEVDVHLLINHPSSPKANEELKKLRLALTICGYFQAVNHGIEISLLEELYDVTKQFFSLPPEEKQKYSRAACGEVACFGNDQFLTGNQTLDGNDRLYLNLYPEDERKLKLWPEHPKNFRKIVLEYRAKLRKLNEVILKAMAKSLNLEENCFLKQYGENPTVVSRFNSYPPPPSPDPEIHLASKPHSDASALTFRLHDKEVKGLQFLLDNQWFRIKVIPHAILVSVGDQTEIMTNGIFKSPIHRFVPNSETEKISISVFFNPDKGNVIEPAEGLADEKRPRLYKQVVDYAGSFCHEDHDGKRAIDALKI